MKKRGIIAIMLMSAFVLSGCYNNPTDPDDPTPPTPPDEDEIEYPVDPDGDEDFVENSKWSYEVLITYDNGAATVENNPNGVTYTVDGESVVITSTIKEVRYVVSGTASDGSLKFYSDNKFKLVLDGANINCSDGPALNIQGRKRNFIVLKNSNRLVDGVTYAAGVEGEDMKGALFAEGSIIFSGDGSITVKGNNRHAICSDDRIRVRESATVKVEGAVSDGFHSNDQIMIESGEVRISAQRDGIECGQADIVINGGEIDILSTGDGAKAMRSETDITISGGTISLSTTGSTVYDTEEQDTSSSAGIRSKGTFTIDGNDTMLYIKCTGNGAKGINSIGDININGGNIEVISSGRQYVLGTIDASPKGIKSDASITVSGGTLIVSAGGGSGSEGFKAPVVTIGGGDLRITSYDDCINTDESITVSGGSVSCYSSYNDGFQTDGTISVTGGLIVALADVGNKGGLRSTGAFTITGGTIVGLGGVAVTPATAGTTQKSVIYSGTATSGDYLCIRGGGDILLYKFPRAYSNLTMLFSSGDLSGSTAYTIYSGGSVSGGTDLNGYITDGTYTPGTQVTTFTPSSLVTTVSK